MHKRLIPLVAAAAIAVATLAGAVPASATGNAPVAVSGTGFHEPPQWGLTRVQAEVAGRQLDGIFTAGLRMDAVPAPGECVEAWANFAIRDGQHWFDFVSLGEVCGQSVQEPTSSVFAVYTADFDLYDASRRGWTDTQGWVSIRLATDGRASVEVYAS
jgi:hypothetical protein